MFSTVMPRPHSHCPHIFLNSIIVSLYPEVQLRDLRLPSSWDLVAAAHEESCATALPRTGSQHSSTGFHTPLPASQVLYHPFLYQLFLKNCSEKTSGYIWHAVSSLTGQQIHL